MRADPLERFLRIAGLGTIWQDLEILPVALVGLFEQIQFFLGYTKSIHGFRIVGFVKQRVMEAIQRGAIVLQLQVVRADFVVLGSSMRIEGEKDRWVSFRMRWLLQQRVGAQVDL